MASCCVVICLHRCQALNVVIYSRHSLSCRRVTRQGIVGRALDRDSEYFVGSCGFATFLLYSLHIFEMKRRPKEPHSWIKTIVRIEIWVVQTQSTLQILGVPGNWGVSERMFLTLCSNSSKKPEREKGRCEEAQAWVGEKKWGGSNRDDEIPSNTSSMRESACCVVWPFQQLGTFLLSSRLGKLLASPTQGQVACSQTGELASSPNAFILSSSCRKLFTPTGISIILAACIWISVFWEN